MKFQVNWADAKRFVALLTGDWKARVTWQVFDDKGKHVDWARHKFGSLVDPKIRKWLTKSNRKGCGIYITVGETDGQGRKRANMRKARAVWIDLDGEPLPESWPYNPHIINESSPGRYQCFWFINPTDNLNAASDVQARLAKFFNGDPKITDPARVCRMPGFYHRKRAPFQSRIIESIEPGDAWLERVPLDKIADAHPCDYRSPARRAEDGRSEMPEDGWDNNEDIERGRAFLLTAAPSIEGQGGNNNAYAIACVLNDYGISPEMSVALMREGWNEKCEPPWSNEELERICDNATSYKQNSAGVESVADDFDGVALPESDGTEEKRPKLRFDYQDVEPEEIEWLWPNRFAVGKLGIIAGYPDQGKSQIAINIAAVVSRGGEWPCDEGEATRGAVIILSAEDDAADTIRPRLEAAGADLSQIVGIPSIIKVENGYRVLNLQDDLSRLAREIDEMRKEGRIVRLIIIDPISAYMGGREKGDSFKNTEVRALLTPLKEWASRMRVSVIAISHFNKHGGGRALYRVTDSLAFTAAARTVWLTAEEQNSDRKLFLKGKGNILPGDVGGLVYRIEAKKITHDIIAPFIAWVGETDLTADEALDQRTEKESHSVQEAQDFLHTMLVEGPVEASEIMKAGRANGLSVASIRRAKNAMGVVSAREGGLGADGEWQWSLPDISENDFG